jgi:molecular chaperone DnaJ
MVQVYTPTDINADEKRLLEKLRESDNFKPKPGMKSEKGLFDRMRDMFTE